MPVEIERKYLVHHDKWKRLAKPQGKFYRQGYLVADAEKSVRVRIIEDTGFITIKSASKGSTRLEYEYEIPVSDAKELLDQFTEKEIRKTRYKITHHGKVWEVDEFAGENEGLILAEIELNNEHEKFELPDWIGEEVTDDGRYYNAFLVEHPYREWKR